MTWNIVGAVLLMVILTAGTQMIWLALSGRGGLQPGNGVAASGTLLRTFRYFVIAELVVGAVVGWIVGPIVFRAIGVAA